MAEVPAGEATFVIVGMSVYDHHEDLDFVKTAVPELRDAFTACGFTHELPELSHGGTFREVSGALTGSAPGRGRSLILYWAGHGAREATGDYLLAQDSPAKNFTGLNAMTASTLASVMAQWRFAHALVVVDACYAGATSAQLNRTLEDMFEQQAPEVRAAVEVIAACGPFERIQDGHFAERFVRVLKEGSTGRGWDAGSLHVYAHEVLRAVEELGLRSPRPVYRAYGYPEPMFPNPKAIPGLPPADALTQRDRQRRILASGLRDHFRRAARSIEVDETGWYFIGRTRLLGEVVSWLGQGRPSGLSVLTGSPGTGKSAILGRIATLSDPHYRRLAQEEGALDGAEPGTVPVEGLIDVALHVKNKSLAECRELLATGLDLPTQQGGQWTSHELIQAIRNLNRPLRIVIDALDEGRPDAVFAIASDLILPLAQVPNLRVLVGTRTRTTGPAGGRRPLIDLLAPVSRHVWVVDEDPDVEQDIHTYVTRRLMGASTSPYRGDAERARAAATAVAAASGKIFLFARIVTGVLLRMERPLRLGGEEGYRLLSGVVRDVFEADLARFGDQEVRVRELLTPLAWAEGAGLPRHPVWTAMAGAMSPTGATYDVTDVDWLLDVTGQYVSQSSEDGQTVFRLYHQAFADYFRERDESAVRIQRAVTQALRDTLPADPRRHWASANPYLLRHLSSHASAAGRLGGLTREPGYLAHADPLRLLEVLGKVDPASYPQTRVFWRAAHRLRDSAQRAAVLHLTALEHEPGLVPDIFPPPVGAVLMPRWTRVAPTPFHRTVTGHDAPVTAVGAGELPGGDTIIVSGDKGGAVRVWDAATGIPRTTLAAHDHKVTAVAVGALDDGTPFIASSDHTQVKLWEATTGVPLGFTMTFRRSIRHIEIKDDEVICVGRRWGQAWNVTGGTVREMPQPYAAGYKTTADGDFEVSTVHGATVYTIPEDTGLTTAISATLPDGARIVVAAGMNGTVRVWDVETRALRATLTGHDHVVRSVAAGRSPYGGTMIVSGGDDRTVRVWDASTRTAETPAPRHNPLVVAAGPKVVASGGDDGTVCLRDTDTGRLVSVLTGHVGKVWGVAQGTLPDGTAVIASGGEDGTVRLWDTDTGRPRTVLPGHEDRIWGVTVAALPDGGTIVAGAGGDRTVRTWDASSGAPRATLVGHQDEVNEVAAATLADGTAILVSASRDRTVRIWDAVTGRHRITLTGHSGWIEAVTTWSAADGTVLIASASRDGTARVWDATTGSLRHTYTGHDGPVWGVAFGHMSDGTPVVVTGGSDTNLRMWELSGSMIMRLPMPCVITSVDIHGSTLAVGTSTGVSTFSLA
jgi:WD40 repeat protein